MRIPVRIHSQNQLPHRATTTGPRSRRPTRHDRSGHARSPFRSDDASRCRYRATSGGQNREDATTIGKPLSGHTPTGPAPTTHHPRPAADTVRPGHIGQRCQESGPDPGQHPPILPPFTATPSRTTEHAQSQLLGHPRSDTGRSLCDPQSDIFVQVASPPVRRLSTAAGQGTNELASGASESPSGGAARYAHSRRRSQTPQQDRGADARRSGTLRPPARPGGGLSDPSRVTLLSPTPSTHLDHESPTCMNSIDVDHVDA
jgi:hypothetical protein